MFLPIYLLHSNSLKIHEISTVVPVSQVRGNPACDDILYCAVLGGGGGTVGRILNGIWNGMWNGETLKKR